MDRPRKSKSKTKRRTDNSISAEKNKPRKKSHIKSINEESNSGGKTEYQGKVKVVTSPKTIEYSKVMEKYSDFLSSTNPKGDFNAAYSKYPHYSRPAQPESTGRFNAGVGGKYSSFNSHEEELHIIDKDNSSSFRPNKFPSIGVTEDEKKPRYSQNKTEVSEGKNEKHKENDDDYKYNSRKKSKRKEVKKETSNINKYLSEKEKLKANDNLRRGKSKSENESIRKYSDETTVQQLKQLKEKMKQIEKENEDLRGRSKDSSSKSGEKISLFIKLTRKYSKKIKNILYLLSKLSTLNIQAINEMKDELLQELNYSVEQFDKTVHNPKLLSTLFDNSSPNLKIDSTSPKIFDDIEYDSVLQDNFHFEPQSRLLTAIEKLQSQIKKLEDENEKMKKKLEKSGTDETNERSILSDENEKLKKKLSEERKLRQEIENFVNNIKQTNKDLESKMVILGDEKKALRKTLKGMNDRNESYELIKNKTTNMGNDLKYKESIISYLEDLLRKTKISPKLYNESKYQENYEINNKCRGVDKPGDSGIDKDQDDVSLAGEKNLDQCSEEELNKHAPEKEPERGLANPKADFAQTNRSSALKAEIEALDGEIKQLQNKLKVMIDVNKK